MTPKFEELEHGQWLWMRQELRSAWQEAVLDASIAYSHWRRTRDGSAYSVYRAAQDRADAAQEALSLRYAAERAGDALADRPNAVVRAWRFLSGRHRRPGRAAPGGGRD
jgi:hypothetical protein